MILFRPYFCTIYTVDFCFLTLDIRIPPKLCNKKYGRKTYCHWNSKPLEVLRSNGKHINYTRTVCMYINYTRTVCMYINYTPTVLLGALFADS